MLTIILTSYNRPYLLTRALNSLLGQKDERWKCLLLDDGSDDHTLSVIQDFEDERIKVTRWETPDETRKTSSRYAVLINSVLPQLTEGILGYLCDNVEYHSALVGTVLDYFEANPAYSGYVIHMRDVWLRRGRDGLKPLGTATAFGHWEICPRLQLDEIVSPDEKLDHSQVFHRLPVDVRWDEGIETVKHGDGVFFEKFVQRHGPIKAIAPGKILTLEHLLA